MKKYVLVISIILGILSLTCAVETMTIGTVPEEIVVFIGFEWKYDRTIEEGKSKCTHQWIESDLWRDGGTISDEPIDEYARTVMPCGEDHNGFYCPNFELLLNKICSQCGRVEQWRQHWIEEKKIVQVEIKKSAYEVYRSSFNKVR